MEEFNILKYQKAPYLELDNYRAPEGIKSYFVSMDDGIKIRVCHWLKKKEKGTGTIFLQQGHNEFIEKYFETIQEFIDRGYSVICFDWRGQGMSERMIDDINKSFITDFKRHDKDLEQILEDIIEPFFPKPLIGIGHSMGGCLMLSAFHNHPTKFDYGILSAPMLGFKNEKFLRAASSLMNFLKKDTDYLIGSKPNMGIETPFEENDLTSDKVRYKRTQMLVRKRPSLRLWGVTNGFAKAVRKRFKNIRRKNWAEKIGTNILIINSLNDRVVYSKKTIEMSKRLRNCNLINFDNCEHEIFMEKDIHRKVLWKKIDNFFS
tara:strand:+ start:85 stop:1041 length:957 start_codon:yes stop_codon:yes gene_type:complete